MVITIEKINCFDLEVEKTAPTPMSIIINSITLSRDGGEQAIRCYETAKKITDKKDLTDEELKFVITKVERNVVGYPDFAIGQILKYLKSGSL